MNNKIDTRVFLTGRVPCNSFREYKAECIKRGIHIEDALTYYLYRLKVEQYKELDKVAKQVHNKGGDKSEEKEKDKTKGKKRS